MKMFKATNTGFQLAMIIGSVLILLLAWWFGFFLFGLFCSIPIFLRAFAFESFYFIENDFLYRKDLGGGVKVPFITKIEWPKQYILKLSEVEKIKVSTNLLKGKKLLFIVDGYAIFDFSLSEGAKFLNLIQKDFPHIQIQK